MLALVGAATVVLGLFVLARGQASGSSVIAFGIATGVVIAGYTMWAKHAVDDLAVAAVTLCWGTEATRVLLLAPYALRRQQELRRLGRTRWRDAAGFAVLFSRECRYCGSS